MTVIGERSIVQLDDQGRPLLARAWHQVAAEARPRALVCPICWHDHAAQIRRSCRVEGAGITVLRVPANVGYRCTYCQKLGGL